MKKSRKIISMPIISIIEGVQIGSVKDLVVNPAEKEIAALIVDQKGWFREEKIIPYNKVTNVGDDAITIDQSGNVEKTTNLPEILKLLRERTDPIGMKVISTTGKVLGQVDEYYVKETTGEIVSLEISGKFMEGLLKGKGLLDAEYVFTIGADAIVVKEGTEEKITKIDGGLQETWSTLRDNTSTIWSSTRKKTIDISKTIKDKTKDTIKSVKETTQKNKEQAEEQAPPATISQEETAQEAPVSATEPLEKAVTSVPEAAQPVEEAQAIYLASEDEQDNVESNEQSETNADNSTQGTFSTEDSDTIDSDLPEEKIAH